MTRVVLFCLFIMLINLHQSSDDYIPPKPSARRKNVRNY